MTTAADLVAPTPAPTPARVGQATAVEQSRAVAEVQAAIVVAQQCRRSVTGALSAMRETCGLKALAERAFFRYSRGGGPITGPSVHLARELARCWGNVQYGIVELRRDDHEGISEMQAFAWDVETNTRSVMTFVVPHLRDKKSGPERLTDVRDIYENNANQGARRLREAIFSVLPSWYVEEAKDLCMKTLQDGGGKPLVQRIADAIAAYGRLGIVADQLERKLGRKSDQWTDLDLATLLTVFRALERGETTKEEEFPPARTTGADLLEETPAAKPRKATKNTPAPSAEPPPAEGAKWPEVPAIPGSDT